MKIPYIKLSDTYLQQHGLQYKAGQKEFESGQNIVMGPTVKPNFPAMAKSGGSQIDKQVPLTNNSVRCSSPL